MATSKNIASWLTLGPIFNPAHQTDNHFAGDGHPLAGRIIEDIERNPLKPQELTGALDKAPVEGDKATYGNGEIFPTKEYVWRALSFVELNWAEIRQIHDDIHSRLGAGLLSTDSKDPASFAGKHHALAFFLAYVVSPEAKTTHLSVRSDDALRVWLNGAEILPLRYAGERDINEQSPETAAEISLHQGINILLATVAETHREWGFSARIEDAADLKFLTSKPTPLKVQGRVLDGTGKPLVGSVVQAYDKDLRQETLLGAAQTDRDGRYEITYFKQQFRRSDKTSASLIVRLLGADGAMLLTAPLIPKARPVETVDLSLPAPPRLSEYEEMLTGLTPALMDLHPAELTDEDISFLSSQTGVQSERITLLHQVSRLTQTSELPSEVLYGLAKQGLLSNDSNKPINQPLPALRRGLENAIKTNQIPKDIENQLDSIMDRLRTLLVEQVFQPEREPEHKSLGAFLGVSRLSPKAQAALVGAAMEHEGTTEDFWARLKLTPEFAADSHIDEARLTLQLGALTGYQPSMVKALREKLGDEPKLKELVKLDIHQWHELVRSVGVPSEFANTEGEVGISTYAKYSRGQVEAAFPTAAIIAQVNRQTNIFKSVEQSAEFNAFFDTHPNFDLLTDSVERTDATKGLSNEVRTKIKHFQRLARITPNTQVFHALYDNGISSASQFASMTEGACVARFGEALGDVRLCRLTHSQALTRKNLTVELRTSFGREQEYARPKCIPPAMPDPPPAPDMPFTPAHLSDWFGSLDVCACRECRSVLGPAAYLTDLLHFFIEKETFIQVVNANTGGIIRDEKNKSGLEVLFAGNRRADLEHILLNCQNAETALPYIDLVNEILERAVAETGSPDYQTTWSSDDLAANPEHIEATAYTKVLAKVFYPWNLPLDLYAEEARVYLTHLGTSRYELMEAFYDPDRDPLLDENIAQEYLKLTDVEWGIIDGTASYNVQELWGFKEPFDIIGFLTHPQHVLDRAGITFNELQILLMTGFVNWFGKLNFDFSESSTGCALDNAPINFHADPEAAVRLCRFVRLWRAVGWSIPEVDATLRVFRSPGSIAEIPLLLLYHIKRLHDRLDMPLIELLSFYTDLDQLPSPAYLFHCTDQNQIPKPIGNPECETLFEATFLSRKVAPQDNATFQKNVDFGKLLFNSALEYRTDLDQGTLTPGFRQQFNEISLPPNDQIEIDIEVPNSRWRIYLSEQGEYYAQYVVVKVDAQLDIFQLESIPDYLPQVTAALGIASIDVLSLLNEFPASFDTRPKGAYREAYLARINLSRLYRIARFCRRTDLKIPEFIELVYLIGIDKFPVLMKKGDEHAAPRLTLAFLDELDFVRNSGFGILELAGLLRGRYLPGEAEASLRQNAVILQQLRTGLQKIDADLQFPENSTSRELETLLRQKLALVLQPVEVEKVIAWVNNDPPLLPPTILPDDEWTDKVAALKVLADTLKSKNPDYDACPNFTPLYQVEAPLFGLDQNYQNDLNQGKLSREFRKIFMENEISLPPDTEIKIDIKVPDSQWRILISGVDKYLVIRDGHFLNLPLTIHTLNPNHPSREIKLQKRYYYILETQIGPYLRDLLIRSLIKQRLGRAVCAVKYRFDL